MQHDDYLVSLFDATFGADSKGPASMEEFKNKYLSMMLVRNQTIKELKAISTLESILERCDDQEIENVFLLQLVTKEET